MTGHGRPSLPRRVLLAVIALALGLLQGSLAWAEPEPSPPEMQADAQLNDICFVDPDRGWAVGDRGVIWRTEDGGRHWRLEDSTVACRLESLAAVEGEVVAVGGWTHPYTHKTSGVVVRSREGGRRFERV